jgi:hypothetical protein
MGSDKYLEKDLILRTRLDLLRDNLKQVQRFVDIAISRRKDLEDLRTVIISDRTIQKGIEKMEAEFGGIASEIEDLLYNSELTHEQNDRLTRLSERTSRAKVEAGQINDLVRQAKDNVQNIWVRAVRIGKGNDLNELGMTLKHYITEVSEKQVELLNSIEDDRTDEARARVWNEFIGKVYKTSKPVFEDYVDFLSGLALRDAGFDEEICEIADELLSKALSAPGMPRWQYLTIPAQRDFVSVAVARIIRLGFPEWSLWTLPLAAHELGHIVVSETWAVKVKDYPADQVSQQHLREFLADVFATITMGPSYACAALLLRFDVLSAYDETDDDPSYARRAFVILGILDRMNRKNSVIPRYATADLDLPETLREEWEAALLQAKMQGKVDEKKMSALTEYIWDFLCEDSFKYTDFPEGESIYDWPDLLLKNKESELDGKLQLRDILNAAWIARIKLARTGAMGVTTKNIADSAKNLWKKTGGRKTRRSGFAGTSDSAAKLVGKGDKRGEGKYGRQE